MATTTMNRKYQQDSDNNRDNKRKRMLERMQEIEAQHRRLSNALANDDPSLIRE